MPTSPPNSVLLRKRLPVFELPPLSHFYYSSEVEKSEAHFEDVLNHLYLPPWKSLNVQEPKGLKFGHVGEKKYCTLVI
jgi:hypothetical protein